ncbi:unnamed protein product, partial [Staurois parvus]
WGPRTIRDHGAPVSSPTPKKAYEKANESFVSGGLTPYSGLKRSIMSSSFE